LYQCTFSLSADGVVTLNDDEKEVAVVTTYEPVEESEDEVKAAAAAKIASAAAGAPASEPTKKPCGCGPKAAEKKPMKTREERITALMACEHSPVKDKAILESLTDAQLKVMSKNGKILTALGQGSEFKVCATKADAEEVIKKMADAHTALHGYAGTMAAKAAKDSTPPAGEDGTAGKGSTQKVDQAKGSKDPKAAQAATFAELLEAADPDTRTAINAATAAAKARKAESIKSLKANPKSKFTDEQLEAMPVGEIRDYSGAGTTRKDAPEGIPAPTDLGEAIRAARAKK
jgi:hypothetical protein